MPDRIVLRISRYGNHVEPIFEQVGQCPEIGVPSGDHLFDFLFIDGLFRSHDISSTGLDLYEGYISVFLSNNVDLDMIADTPVTLPDHVAFRNKIFGGYLLGFTSPFTVFCSSGNVIGPLYL